MDTFANLLISLEKDVGELVGGLESEINNYLSKKPASVSPSASANSSAPATDGGKSLYNPKWKGLRGIWRWLWKGHSKDNPDYAHLYAKENIKRRPTLKEYLEYQSKIEQCADEILQEQFGNLLLENRDPFVTNLMNLFRQKFKNLIRAYQSKIKDTAETPTVPASPEPARRAEVEPVVRSEPSGSDSASVATAPGDTTSSNTESVPNKRDRMKWIDQAVQKIQSDEKIEAPEKSWLTSSQAKLKEEKLISAIIWLAHESNAKHELNSETAKKELSARLGSQFKQDVFKTLRQWYKFNFDEVLNKLTKPAETKPAETKPAETKPAETKPAETKPAETKPAETKPAETKPAETKPAETKPAETKPAAVKPKTKSKESEPVKKEPPVEMVKNKEDKIIEKLGSDVSGKNKSEILKSIESKVIEPIWIGLTEDGKEEEAEKIRMWWIDFSSEDNTQDEESLLSFISTGSLFKSMQKATDMKMKISQLVNYLN